MTDQTRRHSTHIATPVFAESVETLRAMIIDAIDAGATLIELRLDLMWEIDDEDVRLAIENFPAHVRFILTCRSAAEGGAGTLSDRERVERMALLADAVDFLDVELATWRVPHNRSVIASALARLSSTRTTQPSEASALGPQSGLILSMHDFKGRPKSLLGDVLACAEEAACTVIKVVWQPTSVRACFEAFELLRGSAKPMIALCLGELGQLSRLWAPRFGAFASFFALDAQHASAPGQLTIAAARDSYRWDTFSSETNFFGVIGHPVAHSLSPTLHNSVFTAESIDAAYGQFDVAPSYEAFKALMVDIEARPWLGVRGFSVTAPHKEHAVRYLQEVGGSVDALAAKIGAVNTLCFDTDSGWRGTNTDAPGAWQALKSAMANHGRDGGEIKHALVLGAGGAARAIVSVLIANSIDVTVANRDAQRAQTLVEAVGGRVCPWDQRTEQPFDLLVNCTPVGQLPDVEACPWPPEVPMKTDAVVFDTVYRPHKTKLLQLAEAAGALAVPGLSMLVAQAELQFTEWWGRAPRPGGYATAAEQALAADC